MNPTAAVQQTLEAIEKAHRVGMNSEYLLTRPVSDDEYTLIQLAMGLCERSHIDSCALLWIAPEMVNLLLHAATTLPPYEFSPSVLPWPRALCMASKPLMSVPHPSPDLTDHASVRITALMWTDYVADILDGTHLVSGMSYFHGPDLLTPFTVMTLKPGSNWDGLRGWDSPDRIGPYSVNATRDQSLAAGRLLCTLWLLLQQKVAVKRRVYLDRASRRRMERADRPIPDVTIVELRRPINHAPGDGTSAPVDWTHRWMVDGHWRNQYHPSTETHVPTWIAPYVKGPEDKPLVVKRRINAWVR